jgi:hypothetical protein
VSDDERRHLAYAACFGALLFARRLRYSGRSVLATVGYAIERRAFAELARLDAAAKRELALAMALLREAQRASRPPADPRPN